MDKFGSLQKNVAELETELASLRLSMDSVCKENATLKTKLSSVASNLEEARIIVGILHDTLDNCHRSRIVLVS